jgi:hypothetical protein
LADRLGVADAMTIAACVPLVTLPLVLTIPFARIEEV